MFRNSGFHVGAVAVIVLLFISACSSGSNPVTGNYPGDNGLSNGRSMSGVDSNRMLWGYYNCMIDPATNTVEVIPARGVMMHVNAVEWMQPPAGKTSNMVITIIDGAHFSTQGRFDIDIGLKHPFAGANQYAGFDVMGVFITDGHRTLNSEPGVTINDGGTQDSTMLNPDGYTRWWNQDEFDDPTISILSHITGKLGTGQAGLNAKLNPYKYFTDGLTPTGDAGAWLGTNSAKRGLFSPGTTNTRRYQMKWPMSLGSPVFRFDYAIVASWEPATVIPPTQLPQDFPISANALEPVALSVTDNSGLFYVNTTTAGGGIDFKLEVFSWQGMKPGQTIPDTINRIVVESQSAHLNLPGGFIAEDSSTWGTVNAGGPNSSVWTIDIPSLSPTSSADANLIIGFETKFDYDNGFGTGFPTGAPLTSYFRHTVKISPFDIGAPLPPFCNAPVPEFASRNIIDLEDITANVGDPNGDPVNIDWSIVQSGDPELWQTIDNDILAVNWWDATADGTLPGDYDVCVSVYNSEGFAECCTTISVDDAPTLQPVTGQNGITLSHQPDQGAQIPDIAVADYGAGSVGEIMVQDIPGNTVRVYKYNDAYTSDTGIATLDTSGLSGTEFDSVTDWADFKHFDLTQGGNLIHITSGNTTSNPSFTGPAAPNIDINDPRYSYVNPFYTASNGLFSYTDYPGLTGDFGWPAGNPDPDAVPWKHMVDWSGGVISGTPALPNTRVYGILTLSEDWLIQYPTQQHPGSIWMAYSLSPYSDPTTDLKQVELPDMSSYASPISGPVDDTTPSAMALGVDDDNPFIVDWDPGAGVNNSPLTVWYLLSGESIPTARKVHVIWMPRDYNINSFDYKEFIGTGSTWGLDFGAGNWPVDVECVYANRTGSNLDHNYNWIAVLVDTGTEWMVQVYRYEPETPSFVPVASYAGDVGTPQAMDVDSVEGEIHVLWKDTSPNPYKVTVLHFIP